MVERSANAALVRKGPLHQVAATFLEAQIGWDRPHLLGFGFPSERAFAVAQRMGLYGEVDKVMSVSWPAAEPAAAGLGRITHQALGQAGTAFSADERLRVDRLWQRMAAALSDRVLGVRDADWLQQRYLMHPSQRYELLLVRRGWLRRPVGLLVLRRHDTHLALLDMVGVPDNFGHLVQAARQRAQALNLPRVEAWMTAAQLPQMITVGAERPSVTDPKITLPCATHTAGPGADEQRGRWWLMAGDADFT